jgi:NAD(P)-dependent dehydrogenase (short-subunit alcohol dehydrogenase family)
LGKQPNWKQKGYQLQDYTDQTPGFSSQNRFLSRIQGTGMLFSSFNSSRSHFMSVTISLEGKTAIVTGGGRGIGKGIAKRYAEAGANVTIASRKMEVLEDTANEFASLPGKILPVSCNVGYAEELQKVVDATTSEFGGIDIVVNNSATNIGQGPSLDVTDEMMDKMVDVNVKAVHRMVRMTVPGMIERGTGGSIINIVSIAGLGPQPQGLLYSFTKAGLIMMTKNYAQEFGEHGIRVNAIAPGLIKTDFAKFFTDNPKVVEQVMKTQPIKHIGETSEIADAALYLASDSSSYMTGETLVIDGGALVAPRR